MNPHSRVGISVLHTVPRFETQPGIRSVVGKIFSGRSEGSHLPSY
jgi:hypothetical protein